MATVAKLLQDGQLIHIEIEIENSAGPWRHLYALPDAEHQPTFLRRWLEETLPTLPTSIGAEDTPEEQLYGLLELYADGQILNFGDMYKPLHPRGQGVWEFRTLDVRMFGWFACKDCFIGVFADDATRIHKYGLYAGYLNEIVRLRSALDIDEPKFVAGEDPNDLISLRP